MSKIDRILLLLVGLFGSVVAQASTIDELIAQQREAASVAALKKSNESKLSAVSPLPAIVDVANNPVLPNVSVAPNRIENTKVDDLRLIAIYGVERNLTADIYYNGAVFSVSQGGETVDGWRVQTITPSRVVLQHLMAGKGKKQKTHVIYLSDPTINMTTPNAQDVSTSALRGGIPPIRNVAQR